VYPILNISWRPVVSYCLPMSILDDLEAFLQEHRHCGELRSGTWEARVIHGVVDCSCGGYVAKPINSADEDDGRRRRPS